jgi:antitoxin HicB
VAYGPSILYGSQLQDPLDALTSQPEGGYTLTRPALPEFIPEGDTGEEALAQVQDALAAVIELYEDLGQPLPDTILGDPNRITFEHPVTVA